MKHLLLLTAFLVSSIAAIAQAPTAALAGGIGNNYIAPSVTFSGGNTSFGIDGKFGIADNISLRPYVFFPSAGIQLGSSVTYDWDLRQASLPITPFIGLGALFQTGNDSRSTVYAQVGADFNISENIALLGAVAFPFSNNFVTGVTLGAGLRF